jgi:predicted RNase H-like HicB family nuclease
MPHINKNKKKNMEKLIISIGASSNHFGAYAVNCPGIYGAGDTVVEAKKNVLEGLRLFIEHNRDNLPEILKKEHEIEYLFDVQSFLHYYSGIFTKSALERITGINQTQLSHYVSGYRNPSPKTVRKLDEAIRRFAGELSQTHFI